MLGQSSIVTTIRIGVRTYNKVPEEFQLFVPGEQTAQSPYVKQSLQDYVLIVKAAPKQRHINSLSFSV
jgi:hypothetical protein